MSSVTIPQAVSAAAGGGRELLLDARNVTMQFGGLRAVNDVSLQVHTGEIVGLIGPNGAGKTTFFNCLTGLYKPTSGTVYFGGEPLPPQPRLACPLPASPTASSRPTTRTWLHSGWPHLTWNLASPRTCRRSSS